MTWLCEPSPFFQYTGTPPRLAHRTSSPLPGGAGAVMAIPREGRIRENEPTRWLPLQVLPIRWTVGGISTEGGAN